MDIEALLDELGQRMGIDSLALGPNGLCRVVFDERMVVDVEVDRTHDVACLHGVVASRDACEGEAVLEELLAANLMGVNGHDNFLCLDVERRELVLFSRLPSLDLDYESFSARLEHFVDDLEHWLDRFGEGDVGGVGGGRDASSAPADGVAVRPFGSLGGVRV